MSPYDFFVSLLFFQYQIHFFCVFDLKTFGVRLLHTQELCFVVLWTFLMFSHRLRRSFSLTSSARKGWAGKARREGSAKPPRRQG